MNWTDLAGTLAKTGAPVVGSILAEPAGAALGGSIGNLLAAALGTEATPEAVSTAIAIDPAAPAKLQQVDADHGPRLKSLAELDNDDRARASSQTLALVDRNSAIAWGAPITSLLVVAGFIALTFALLFRSVPDSQAGLVLFGSLSTAFGQVVNYWLGSSHSSQNKDSTIAGLLRGTAPVLTQVAKAIRK